MTTISHNKPQAAPQVAGRGLVIHEDRLLLVNGDGDGTFWVPPGGRADLGEDIKSCVKREVYEETGLQVSVGAMIAVSEYFDEVADFHILQAHFLCTIESGTLSDNWVDHDGPVRHARFYTLEEMKGLPRVFPSFLLEGGWQNFKDHGLYKGFERRDIQT